MTLNGCHDYRNLREMMIDSRAAQLKECLLLKHDNAIDLRSSNIYHTKVFMAKSFDRNKYHFFHSHVFIKTMQIYLSQFDDDVN